MVILFQEYIPIVVRTEVYVMSWLKMVVCLIFIQKFRAKKYSESKGYLTTWFSDATGGGWEEYS